MKYLTIDDMERIRLPNKLVREHPGNRFRRVYIFVDDLPNNQQMALADRIAREVIRSFRVIPREGSPREDGYTPETRYRELMRMFGSDRIYLDIEKGAIRELRIV